jgi:hypothetical protein
MEVLMASVEVIQMGVGTVGQAATRSLVVKKGLDIVGALDLDKARVGRDLGEVAGLGKKLGVMVTDDADSVFAETHADVVIHIACTYMHDAYLQISKPIQQGMNVISAAEALGNPYVRDPGLAAKLQKLAKKHGVTVLGSGLSPGFTSDYLILALTAACSELRQIGYKRVSDASAYLGGTVGRHFGLGLSPEEFKKGVKEGEIIGHIGFVESVRTIADRLGWQLDKIERSTEPVHDDRGQFVSTRTIVRGMRDGELKIELDLEACVDPKVETMDRIIIDGWPPIDLVIKPAIPSVPATANALVNAIPHVINAEPGLMTPGDLPLVFALEDDLRRFLK